MTTQSDNIRIIGTKPQGNTGGARWVLVSTDDTDVVITAYRGWLVTDTVRLSGESAIAQVDAIVAAFNPVTAPTKTYDSVITTEALISGPLKSGKTYLVKKNNQTVGRATYTGKRGGRNVWTLQDSTGYTFAIAYAGTLAQVAAAVASN